MGRLVKRSLQEEREHTIKRVSTEQSSKAVPGSTSLQSAVGRIFSLYLAKDVTPKLLLVNTALGD
jgi:hypothetical protein